MEQLMAGAAEVVITPPAGIDLTGYANRPSAAVGKHDDLYARALALQGEQSGGSRLALVSIDVLGFEIGDADRLRRLVEQEAGIPAAAVLLNCSHTHAGPATMALRGLGQRDPAYDTLLARWIAGAVRAAHDRLEPAVLRWGETQAWIGRNRREQRPDGRMVIGANEGGPYDPRVATLRLDRADGSPLAIWFSHATHPVTYGSDNVRFSADYPGAAVETVRRLAPGGSADFTALFAQGCCGDINPRRRGGGPEAQTSGRILGAAAAIAAEESTAIGAAPLAAALETLALPTLPPAVEEARALKERHAARREELRAEGAGAYRLRQPEAMIAWADDALAAAQRPPEERTLPFPVQALRLGPVAVVAMAGEVFVRIGQEIARRSPFPHTVVLGYSNGLLGYVPTADAYPLGGYEVSDAYRYFGTLMIAPESEALILACIDRLLARLENH
jgi:neutral/alkaline ceramidase-like enzyme